MKLKEDKGFTDGKCGRCKKNFNIKHNIKVNIRSNSILSEMKTNIRLVYFIIIEIFVRNNSANLTFKNCSFIFKNLNLIIQFNYYFIMFILLYYFIYIISL